MMNLQPEVWRCSVVWWYAIKTMFLLFHYRGWQNQQKINISCSFLANHDAKDTPVVKIILQEQVFKAKYLSKVLILQKNFTYDWYIILCNINRFVLLMHQYLSIILDVLTGLMVVHWFQFKSQAPLKGPMINLRKSEMIPSWETKKKTQFCHINLYSYVGPVSKMLFWEMLDDCTCNLPSWHSKCDWNETIWDV